MPKKLETNFKRIETKYIVPKNQLDDLISDLKKYLVEDDYPTSTITNIYFDNKNFEIIKDSINHKYHQEKIRMRTYVAEPKPNSLGFLEIKKKDDEGVGHKFRIASNPLSITQFVTQGITDEHITDSDLIEEIHSLRERYENLVPRMFIYYDRYSLKEKHTIKGYSFTNTRVTIDKNLTFRDENVSFFEGKHGEPLLDDAHVIMEIKAPGHKPDWLQAILDKYGLEEKHFSKYNTAYHKSQKLPIKHSL
ncbi:polyphosphate polymerase domain-containing protein [Streptococcus dentapri]|uniref:Polyphosphate polymerase domain-containing protein n=1 Tax=Streptococcus dentapri TaxID=573564 RepID=A0ABV8D2J5_9STRE